jgi:hypothetical protein
MAWRVAKSLETLRMQVNAKWPGRSRASDGTIGDAAHADGVSDHNPDENGVVKALDLTHDPLHGPDARKLAEALVASKDARIKYIISNGEIVSGMGQDHPAWVWRRYTKSNPHRKHVHVSVRKPSALYDLETPWQIGQRSGVGSVQWIQAELNKRGAKLKEDGIDGPATAAALRAFAIEQLKG